ncbi:hypothetical protein [Paenibacillus sedimenti]|uniref:Uncharacterized protein n=1 Tax=Paenibacillus sedimenti TaxID=2770274 RepID=A0A926KNV9_9BACL|nr:hypothetical protein [Paenibacillus sedimenti]MBD0379559.1 hypothetical protein [Paenibacillus sedimenti]
MIVKIIMWTSLILPWITLFAMKKSMIKRYMPVSILAALVVTIFFEIAYVYNWWILKIKIVTWGNITNISFVYGFFLVGTLWIFRLTFGKFWIYFLTNLIVDSLHLYFFQNIFERMGVFTMANVAKWQLLLLMTAVSLFLYTYQRWQETIFQPSRDDAGYFFDKEIEFKSLVREKSKT